MTGCTSTITAGPTADWEVSRHARSTTLRRTTPRISAAWSPNLSPRVPSVIPPGIDLTYSWSQAQADLSQIAPIVALTGFFLFAVVVDLVLPRSRRGGAVAMFAVTGFALSLLVAGYRWVNG